ncbi:MAG: carboxylesterase family protein [Treponema sp.]|nr:carboxylesterase family protein [Treponema sp.]
MPRKFICTATEPVVQTTKGKIRGFILDGTYTFHGIRYAQAKRFMPPTPVESWEGVKDALSYGPICPLLDNPMPSGEILIPHRFWPASEHCQYLNIWSRSLDPKAKKPVMVWLHGGGFSAGSSIEQVAYEGENLAVYGDVVVVSINHRLNILGYFDLSAFGKQYANSVNAGMADIVESLKWIKENIEAFGGDSGNVTVFGQSGGGMKVTTLGQIPEAEGLFHKAIVMSGIAEMNMGGNVDHAEVVREILKELDMKEDEVAKLEKINFAVLAKAFNRVNRKFRKEGKNVGWGPQKNDWYTGDVFDVGFSAFSKTIPTMAGTVIAEFAFAPGTPNKDSLSPEERREILFKRYGEHTDELIRLFKKAYPGKNEVDLALVDGLFRPATLKYADIKSKEASAPFYSYMFALDFDYDYGKPAWHCSDIPFFFHNSALVPICNIQGVTEKLEEEMAGAFVAFARTGDPNHKNMIKWPAYTPENKATIVFDRKTEIRVDYEAELLDLLKKATPPVDMAARMRVVDEDEEELRAWMY